MAEQLGVQYVLEGSVERSGDKLRVMAQLIDALKGHHLWSERYDVMMDDLLSVQDKIALNVLVETQVKLAVGERVRLSKGVKKAIDPETGIYGHLLLASAYSLSGQQDAARIEAAEVVRINPKFSLVVYEKRSRVAFNKQADIERYYAGLRIAGLK